MTGVLTRDPGLRIHPNSSQKSRLFTPRRLAQLVATAYGVAALGTALANPTDPKVVAGSASFSQSGGSLIVRNTPGAIINWGSFSIASGELTDFLQQSSSSMVFNRVTGLNPSLILGSLESNGRVFLINANGVVFGKSAVVDAAGLVVSTLDASNASLQSGSWQLSSGTSASSIVNDGVLRSESGDIYLIAPNIQNNGTITARGGNAVLAAGQSVDILGSGLDNISFQVQNTSNSALNLGSMSGDAVGMFAGAVNQSGSVNANAVSVVGGRVVLSALGNVTLGAGSTTSADGSVKGGSISVDSKTGDVSVASDAALSASGQSGGTITLLAEHGSDTVYGSLGATGTLSLAETGSGGAGGTIDVLGQSVSLLSGAKLDASGDTAGGTVYVGGGPHGTDAALMNSQNTLIASGAEVDANARLNGNGGHIVVFGENTGTVAGLLSATGGVGGGDGGYIETSAHGVLSVDNAPALTAGLHGKGGTWLFDPTDVDIVTAAGAPTTGVSYMLASTIVSELNGGGSLVISTSEGSGAPNGGTITVNAPLAFTLTAAANLTLDATNAIVINQSITNTYSNGYIPLNLTLSAPNGAISIPYGTSSQTQVVTQGGNFTATSSTFTSSGDLESGGNYTGNNGNMSITTTGAGGITLGTQSYLRPGYTFVLSAGGTGSVTLGGYLYQDNDQGSLSISGNSIALGNAQFSSNNNATFSANTSTGSITGTLALEAVNASMTAHTISGTLNLNNTASTLNLNANDVALNMSIQAYYGPGYVVINGTGIGTSPQMTLSFPSGQQVGTTYIGAGPFANGLSGYNTLNFVNTALEVDTSLTVPGALNLTVQGGSTADGATSLQVGYTGNTAGPSLIQAGTTSNIGVSGGNLVLVGGAASGASATIISGSGSTYNVAPANGIGGTVNLTGGSATNTFAVIDPANVTVNAVGMSLTGGTGNNSYAAITSTGNTVVNLAGALVFTGGTGQNADAVITAPNGTVTVTGDNPCTGCGDLTFNPLTNQLVQTGFYGPGPVVVPTNGTPIATILGNYDTSSQDTTLVDLVFTGGPGDISTAIFVIDEFCGGGL